MDDRQGRLHGVPDPTVRRPLGGVGSGSPPTVEPEGYLEALRSAFSGTPGAFESLVLRFVTNCGALVERLQVALDEARADQVHLAAHSLKSSSAMLECCESSRLCASLERLGEAGDLEAARGEMPALRGVLELELGRVRHRFLEGAGALEG